MSRAQLLLRMMMFDFCLRKRGMHCCCNTAVERHTLSQVDLVLQREHAHIRAVTPAKPMLLTAINSNYRLQPADGLCFCERDLACVPRYALLQSPLQQRL